MTRYIVVRVLMMFVTMLVLVTISYFAMSFATYEYYTELGFREYFSATWTSYKVYLWNIITQWEFGVTGTEETPPWDILLEYLGVSLKINLIAFAIYLPLGIVFGVICGIFRNSLFDRVFNFLALIINSIPIFILMFLFIFFLGFKLKFGHYQWVAGWGARNYILPVLALILAPIHRISRVIRSEVIETATSEHILLARTKGMTHTQAMWRHTVRQSFAGVLHDLPGTFLYALTGSIFVEIVYHIDGVAYLLVRSLLRISPVGGLYVFIEIEVVMVILMFYTMLSMVLNLLVDILLVIVDPRIRQELIK